MQLKEYLYTERIKPENVGYICGYFSDKPHEWEAIFLMRCKGCEQKEIAERVNLTQQRVSQILSNIKNGIQVIICK